MGTIPEVPPRGLIYLQSSVTSEFNKRLEGTDHASADNFLEHLLELFTKANRNDRFLQVRPNLAQKFAAVQQGSQFSSSSDLMKNLLELHNKNQNTPSTELVKQVQEKPSVSGTGRKSRKSQPKRNLKHQVLVDSHSENVESTPESGTPGWRERSVSSEELDSTPADANDASVPFDLSMVKQEVVVVEDDQDKVASSKGEGNESKPLCLSLHRPKLAQDTRRPAAQPNTSKPNTSKPNTSKPEMITLESTTRRNNHNAEKLKHLFQMNWRSSSEPPTQYRDKHWEPEREESRNHVTAYTGMVPVAEKMEVEAEESGGYNYVLTSLAGDEKSQNNSLPDSPMHVPVKYPKSIHYVLSSEEEEPQDLTCASAPNEQPQNLTMSKPPKLIQFPVKGETIKYDSNANAVAVSVSAHNAQHEKLSFAQPPFSVPHNLIFNDRRSVKTEHGNQPQQQKQPQGLPVPQAIPSASTMEAAAALQSQPSIIIAAPPPGLQVVNVIGASQSMTTPVYIQPNIIAAKPGFPAGSTPLFGTLVTSPDAQPPNTTPGTDSDTSFEQLSPGTRKRRKKMDDTTLFRDPPETSLPFNGPNKYRFYCDVCDTGFTRRYTFNRHKCKGRVEKHYCQLCDKAYLSKYKLKDHILVKHEGQTVSCPDCGKKFSSRSSMEMHKKQQHEGQFSIWCKICGKGFNHTGHYYGHMNKHTNTKPFWCQQCGKRFYGSSYLHNHKQVCRGNSDLNYPCTMCDRKFKCELYLKKHMKTHENIPIIADPTVAKTSGVELSEAGVGLPSPEDLETNLRTVNGGTGALVFPNGPENSDSNSNSGMLVIDENMNASVDEKPVVKDELKVGVMPAELSKGDGLKVRGSSQVVTA